MPRMLGGCSILVAPFNPSVDPYMREHGFIFSPLKIFEYMSLSRAIISSDLEKIREVISHNNTGIILPPGSSEEIAESIDQLISHPVLADKLGKRARRTVLRLFSWKRLSKVINRALLDATPGEST
jgi:glycosyltransferase involved in cell wall biosynthesis